MKYGSPLREGEKIELKNKNWDLVCCSCGLVHTVEFEIEKGKVYLRLYKKNRSTAQRRRFGKPQLISGEDQNWQMQRRSIEHPAPQE